jgi:hypothetical protein
VPFRFSFFRITQNSQPGHRSSFYGQFFFPDALTAAVYKAAPYASRGMPDTPNARDSIFVNGGKRSMLAVARSGAGYVGSIAMGVHK